MLSSMISLVVTGLTSAIGCGLRLRGELRNRRLGQRRGAPGQYFPIDDREARPPTHLVFGSHRFLSEFDDRHDFDAAQQAHRDGALPQFVGCDVAADRRRRKNEFLSGPRVNEADDRLMLPRRARVAVQVQFPHVFWDFGV
jgi:hypothetical protein